MKKYFILFVLNSIMFAPLLIGYIFNDYHFFIKAFIYIMLTVVFVVELALIKNGVNFDNYYEKQKEKPELYWTISTILSFPYMIFFALLDYHVIFVLYLIHFVLYLAIIGKIFDRRRKEEANNGSSR